MHTLRTIILQALIAVSMLALLTIDAAAAWPFKTDNGYATCVAADRDGNVIAAGSFSGVGPTYDVFKLSGRDGSVIWHFHLNSGSPTKVAVDPNGDVIVGSGAITKLSGATGALLWTRSAATRDTTDLKIDQQGNIIAAGAGSFRVIKLDTNGYLIWDYIAPNGLKDCEPVPSEDSANAIALDQTGNVFAVGTVGQDFSVVKLSGATGEPLSSMLNIEGAGDCSTQDVAKAVGIDPLGDVIVAGEISSPGEDIERPYPTTDFAVMKLTGDSLTQLWDHRLDGSSHGTDHANALAVDSTGDVVVAGSLDNFHRILGQTFQQGQQFAIVKLAADDGATIWKVGANADDEAPFENGAATSVVLNRSGNVIATGNYAGTFTVVKKFAASGKNWWRHQDPDTPASYALDMRGNEVALDRENNVLVAGQTQIALETPLRFTVLKLARLSGETFNGPSNFISDLAPLVYLHSGDVYRPGDPADYINNCRLRWSHAAGCTDRTVAEIGSIRQPRLGQKQGEGNIHIPYTHNPIAQNNTCTELRKTKFAASDYTRPYDDGRGSDEDDDGIPINTSLLSKSFYEREGFYLDLYDCEDFPESCDESLQESLRHGIPSVPGSSIYPGAPVFYEYRKGEYITYWFFYPYDKFDLDLIIPGSQEHEGDWERISIQLDADDEPHNVLYYTHGGENGPVAWGDVNKSLGTHPIVFSAKGSHASYFNGGSHVRPIGIDFTNDELSWMTWTGTLAPVTGQVWYGYGGAWGEVGDGACFPEIGCLRGQDYTGPLGPSRYKTSAKFWREHPYERNPSALSLTPVNAQTTEGTDRAEPGIEP
jgi:hypothetical protein